jgi:hypothetical protein
MEAAILPVDAIAGAAVEGRFRRHKRADERKVRSVTFARRGCKVSRCNSFLQMG